mgnify:CR=1 FL=1
MSNKYIIRNDKLVRVVNIRIDADERYFRKSRINQDEIKYLLYHNYKIARYKSLLTNKMEIFFLKPRHNESLTHFFMTRNIAEFLEKNGIEVELYITVKPDITFQINGKKYAIEIETGSAFSKIKNLKEKVKLLNENYDKWFFVVTKRKFVKKFKQFGDSIDKRYVKLRLNKLIKLAEKAQR